MPQPLKSKIQHILISRTDAIGDVVLTLPMAAYIKELLPGVVVSFLGRTYTQPVINTCAAVDIFINYDEIKKLSQAEQVSYLKDKKIDAIIHVFPNKHVAQIARAAGIKLRIGTTNRVFHWFTCNKLVKLSRKKSDLHEAQLNLILLKPLGLAAVPSLQDIIEHIGFESRALFPPELAGKLSGDKFNLIIHPKSHGSGMEWGLDNYGKLIDKLPSDIFNIIITGSDKEKILLADWIATLPATVVDMTGKMSLPQLISLISQADGLIASGTGPLHIAAMAGINTLGLFPSVRPIHPGRWAPLGKKAGFMESGTDNLLPLSVNLVAEKITSWLL
ncbi:glycosyltransferase family 9 protein [Mucilaginibacter ginsenosidivorax]|uniref:Glycosyltransferase family 9 protein n=1 Tax=Mucilaginibacter ginsenosidivorax TaxID=862126 RepID=A0A5B8VY60_9SPHI|nr:glycosyltransferase family 9 protein [Mucilaginibacter ginsenosidivorax]QEC76389.1 glycosyltransferase family 9 protein [Mucilaginibacter ginsenosidivorax]